jgi:tRNA threonylcarbamoyladenosine biosynthesis protein TsaE
MPSVLTCASAAETLALGRRLGETAPEAGVLTLAGPLGAGKTVLAQGVLAGLGVPAPHPSPTFTIVRRYVRPGPGRGPVWHVDAYRLGGPEEDLGWDEVLTGDGLVLVEWPEALASILPGDRLDVSLARQGPSGEERMVRLMARGSVARAWLARALAGLSDAVRPAGRQA